MQTAVMLAVIFGIEALSGAVSSSSESCKVECPIIEQTLEKLPLYFIENKGQLEKRVAYYIQGSDKTLYFTSEGVTFALTGQNPDETRRWATKMGFVDSHTVRPEGEDKQSAVFGYFNGKPEAWKTDISTFSRLIYRNLWPGIDLVFSGTSDRLKYEFVVQPGADPGRIRLVYRGVTGLSLKESGALMVTTPVTDFEDGRPVAFQTVDDEKVFVPTRYSLMGKSDGGCFTYGFETGPFDPNAQLIIDPTVIVYCGYIGGEQYDEGRGIAVDGEGNIYVTGLTESTALSFPVKEGPDLNYNGGLYDAFLLKVNAQGSTLEYCGYIGGSDIDWGCDVALDNMGNAYVVGFTYSDELSFPVKIGPDVTHHGVSDAFVAKVNAQGTSLEYCGYIGGDDFDAGYGIDVDNDGNAYVTGLTWSDEGSLQDPNFPAVVGPDLTHNGAKDAFVAKVNALGTVLEYCGYLGGEDIENGMDVAVDGNGNAYVTGETLSDEVSFPVKEGPDLTYSGYGDAYVAKVNAAGLELDYCGYIGGQDWDMGVGITVDDDGKAYLTGFTYSEEQSFPVKEGPELFYKGNRDAFVAKVNDLGTALEYCGYLGGNDVDWGEGIRVDSEGNAYLTGGTYSSEKTFPVKIGPDLSSNGDRDAFLARVHVDGKALDYCGYIGGEDMDCGEAIALDSDGVAYVVGGTYSDESSFPVVGGPILEHNGVSDVFVAKVAYTYSSLTAGNNTLPETGGSIEFTLDAQSENAHRNYILLGSLTGTAPGYPLPGGQANLPLIPDSFTDMVFGLVNSPLFSNFLSELDKSGQAKAQMNAPKIPPGFTGHIMYFAYCCNDPFDFVSNPVEIEIVH